MQWPGPFNSSVCHLKRWLWNGFFRGPGFGEVRHYSHGVKVILAVQSKLNFLLFSLGEAHNGFREDVQHDLSSVFLSHFVLTFERQLGAIGPFTA